jgi:predicted RNase H-like nuclease (RuvC/YqgF family)
MNGRKQIKANLKRAKIAINKLKKEIRLYDERITSLKIQHGRRLEEEKLEARSLQKQLHQNQDEFKRLEEVIKRVRRWYQIIIWKR